jgi:alanyl-tRNA synthetase
VLPYGEAVATGATHLFEEKYGDRVRVVCFGDWTCEFCGGTHVSNSADVGPALITAESSIGQGLRRIDMTVGEPAESLVRRRLGQLGALARSLGVPPDQVEARVAEIRRELKESERQLERLRDELRAAHLQGAQGGPRRREASVPLALEEVPADGGHDLRGWADRFLEFLGGSGVVGRGGGRPEMAQGKLTKPAPEAFDLVEAALK